MGHHNSPKKNLQKAHPMPKPQQAQMLPSRLVTVSPALHSSTKETEEPDLQTPLAKKVWMDSFKAFETEMLERLNSVLQPLTTRLEEISDSLKEVEKTTEAAMEVSLLNQEDIKGLESREQWATNKILLLEQKTWRNNLKLRGIPEEENASIHTDLVSSWIQVGTGA